MFGCWRLGESIVVSAVRSRPVRLIFSFVEVFKRPSGFRLLIVFLEVSDDGEGAGLAILAGRPSKGDAPSLVRLFAGDFDRLSFEPNLAERVSL